MARFASEEELRTFLRGLDPDYVQYAVKLWQSGIRTPHHLANASRELLLSFVRGICNSTELHIDDIKARAVGKDGKISFDELVGAALPNVEYSGSSKSAKDKDNDRQTHPTEVLRYENYNEDVKYRLQQPDVEVWRGKRYEKIGFAVEDYQLSEDAAVSSLCTTAGGRVNHVFKSNNMKYRFTIHPIKRRTDTQEEEHDSLPQTEIQPEEQAQQDAPDICLLQTEGTMRKIVEVTECKSRFRLLNVQSCHPADIWNGFTSEDGAVPNDVTPPAAYNLVHAISQELGYMSRRGHKTGIISTYHHTWLLKTDGRGKVWISDAIPRERQGDAGLASVTEVMLFSALRNLGDSSEPYPTALVPEQQPVPLNDFKRRRTEAAEQHPQPSSEEAEADSGGRHMRSGAVYSRAAPLPAGALHLTCRLGLQVFLGRLFGRVVAVRLAVGAAAEQAAQLEAQAYGRLQLLQGVLVPRLMVHGYTLGGGAYFTATEYMEGMAWDWHLAAHRALDKEVLSALHQIHQLGVLHGDLHAGNILVTPENKIVVLDFDGACLEAPANQLTAEQDHWAMLLAVQVHVH